MEQDFDWRQPPPEHRGLANSAFILGIISCSLNLLIITTPVGLICGILALVFGAATRKRGRGNAGFVLALFSFFVMLVWIMTIAVIYVKDPFLRALIK